MRNNLKQARIQARLTQKQVAEILGITEQHYQKIEYGKTIGKVALWDDLEDLFNINQRKLREISATHPDQKDNR